MRARHAGVIAVAFTGLVVGVPGCGGGGKTPEAVFKAAMDASKKDDHKEFLSQQLTEIAPLMGINSFGQPAAKVGNDVVEAVRSLRKEIGVPSKLSDVGMKESDIAQFVDDAQKSQGIFIAAPRPGSADDLTAIYKSAL